MLKKKKKLCSIMTCITLFFLTFSDVKGEELNTNYIETGLKNGHVHNHDVSNELELHNQECDHNHEESNELELHNQECVHSHEEDIEDYQTKILTREHNNSFLDNTKTQEEIVDETVPWNVKKTEINLFHENNIKGTGIKVAIFDTGIDLDNRDLTIAGGVSFVDGIESYDDDNGHGTEMATILAARINGYGLVGIAPEVELYSVKILDKNGIGTYSDVIQGLEWAIENNINIVTLSLGGTEYSKNLEQAIKKAITNNILVIAAAGNNGKKQVMYPAGYSDVISVGAIDCNNQVAQNSNYSTDINLFAFGDNVIAGGLNGSKNVISGTSAAVQHVAGLAALIWSQDYSISAVKIRNILISSTNDYLSEKGEYNVLNAKAVYQKIGKDILSNKDETIDKIIDEIIEDKIETDFIVYTQACSHTYTQPSVTAATCTSPQKLVYRCSKCSATKSETSGTPLGHSPSTTTTAATCTAEGSSKTKCTRCSTTLSTTTLPALGHNYVQQSSTAATCTSPKTLSYKCSRCTSTKSETSGTPLGHSPTTTTDAATCATEGSSKTKCTRCSTTLSTTTLPALGHNYVQQSSTAATCTSPKTLSYKCSRCTSTKSETSGTPLGHSPTTTTDTATCTTAGSSITKCTRCSTTLSTTTLPALGHNYELKSTTAATCTTPKTLSYKCSRCTSTKSETSGTAKGHSTISDTVGATCTKDGSTTVTCKTCQVTLSITPIGKLGHNYAVSTIAATCTTPKIVNYKCSRCSDSYTVTDPVPGHQWTVGKEDATCDKDGYTYKYCSVCGTVTEITTINKLGHNWVSYGTSGKQCSRCNLLHTSHSFYDYINPYHTSQGHWEQIFCLICGEVFLDRFQYSTYRGVSSQHTSSGHSWSSHCSYCDVFMDSGYQIVSTCLSCTTPSSVSIYNINGDTILDETHTSFQLQIKVQDDEDDAVVCNYYLDGSTTASGTMTVTGTKTGKVASFTNVINIANLSEGKHTIRVTAKDPIADEIGTSVTFRVDKSAPVISPPVVEVSTTSIKITTTAEDVTGGLALEPYRYTIGSSTPTVWTSENVFIKTDLTPNTVYTYKVEVRDLNGHISEKTGSISTKVEKPTVQLTPLSENRLQIVIKDANPVTTQYQVKVGNMYVNKSGVLTTTAEWITINYDLVAGDRRILLSELSPNSNYTVMVTALNSNTGAISVGSSVSTITSPAAPRGINVTSVSSTEALITWGNVEGAISYEVYRYTLGEDNSIITELSLGRKISSFIDGKLASNQKYRYIIRAFNASGLSSYWSAPMEFKTLPLPPSAVTEIIATSNGSSLDITWNDIPDAVGYSIELAYNGVSEITFSPSNKLSYDTKFYNTQCDIRIRAFNICDANEPHKSDLWSNAGEWSSQVPFYTDANITRIKAFQAADITHNSIHIAWDANSNPASVEYRLGLFQDGILVRESDYSKELSITMTGLDPDTAYSCKVKARNILLKETDWSEEVVVSTLIDYPNMPGSLIAKSSSNSITLEWDYDAKATNYIIERDDIIINSNCLSNSYTDVGLLPETEYTYQIKAINSTGESEWNQIIKRTKGAIPDTPKITSVSGGAISVNIIWEPTDKASVYQLDIDGQIRDVGDVTFFCHEGLEPNSTHNYRIRAINSFGKSNWSENITFTTSKVVPGAPGIVVLTPSQFQFKVEWNKVQGAEAYEIEIDSSPDLITELSSEFMSPSYAEGSTHTVRVRAINSTGNSEWSGAFSVTLTADVTIPVKPVPATPGNVTSVTGSAFTIVRWNDVEYATYYQVEADNTIVYTGTDTSFTHTGSMDGSVHTYRISAGNSSGQSEWSSPITVQMRGGVLRTPNNLVSRFFGPKQYTIMWNKAEGIEDYQIEINGNIQDGIIHANNTTINVEYGEYYTIRIGALIYIGTETTYEWSEEITFRAIGNLDAPILTTSAGIDNIIVSWTDNVSALGYEIEIDGKPYEIGKVKNYIITNLLPGTEHTIRLRAYSEVSVGDWGEAKTVVTNHNIPGVPTNISYYCVDVKSATGSAISISWNPVEGATSYDVEINGDIYQSTTNTAIIQNLFPGVSYTFRVRANKDTVIGAWSSLISCTPIVMPPTNVSASVVDDNIRIEWDPIAGASLYEISLDGIIYASTTQTSIDLKQDIFSMQRDIRVRAFVGNHKSEWSVKVNFSNTLPYSISVVVGEEISVLLPVVNSDISQYKVTLTYDTDILELIDACEMTPIIEVASVYIEEFNMYITIDNNDNVQSITIYVNQDAGALWTGVINSIRYKSKKTDTAVINYSVTLL